MAAAVRRIAMWSGPRNISTAMMRSFGNRSDAFVCDEPLYAHYLLATGVEHPGADEVIGQHETDWRKVTGWLTEYVPPGKPVFYQKHMAHHLLPDIDRTWMDSLDHAFLIREPRQVIRSFTQVAGEPSIAQTGLPQQLELFSRELDQTGRIPPIVDARDVLENPERQLRLLCDALDLAFDENMLAWPAGSRETDGIWSRHWYGAVNQSTGFLPYRHDDEPVPDHLSGLLEEAEAIYRQLYRHRLS